MNGSKQVVYRVAEPADDLGGGDDANQVETSPDNGKETHWLGPETVERMYEELCQRRRRPVMAAPLPRTSTFWKAQDDWFQYTVYLENWKYLPVRKLGTPYQVGGSGSSTPR